MARFTQAAVLTVCVGGAFVLGRSVATSSTGTAIAAQPEMHGDQPDTDMGKDKDLDMGMVGGPTEHHKHMESMVGEFDVVVRFKMSPMDEEWTESAGTMTREMMLDGMFIREDVDSSMGPGMPRFKAIGIMGYNTFTGKYESTWMENMSSPITFAKGGYDQATKTWTFTGEMFNPMTGDPMKTKSVYNESDPDRHTFASYVLADNGEYWKSMTGVAERRAGGDR